MSEQDGLRSTGSKDRCHMAEDLCLELEQQVKNKSMISRKNRTEVNRVCGTITSLFQTHDALLCRRNIMTDILRVLATLCSVGKTDRFIIRKCSQCVDMVLSTANTHACSGDRCQYLDYICQTLEIFAKSDIKFSYPEQLDIVIALCESMCTNEKCEHYYSSIISQHIRAINALCTMKPRSTVMVEQIISTVFSLRNCLVFSKEDGCLLAGDICTTLTVLPRLYTESGFTVSLRALVFDTLNQIIQDNLSLARHNQCPPIFQVLTEALKRGEINKREFEQFLLIIVNHINTLPGDKCRLSDNLCAIVNILLVCPNSVISGHVEELRKAVMNTVRCHRQEQCQISSLSVIMKVLTTIWDVKELSTEAKIHTSVIMEQLTREVMILLFSQSSVECQHVVVSKRYHCTKHTQKVLSMTGTHDKREIVEIFSSKCFDIWDTLYCVGLRKNNEPYGISPLLVTAMLTDSGFSTHDMTVKLRKFIREKWYHTVLDPKLLESRLRVFEQVPINLLVTAIGKMDQSLLSKRIAELWLYIILEQEEVKMFPQEDELERELVHAIKHLFIPSAWLFSEDIYSIVMNKCFQIICASCTQKSNPADTQPGLSAEVRVDLHDLHEHCLEMLEQFKSFMNRLSQKSDTSSKRAVTKGVLLIQSYIEWVVDNFENSTLTGLLLNAIDGLQLPHVCPKSADHINILCRVIKDVNIEFVKLLLPHTPLGSACTVGDAARSRGSCQSNCGIGGTVLAYAMDNAPPNIMQVICNYVEQNVPFQTRKEILCFQDHNGMSYAHHIVMTLMNKDINDNDIRSCYRLENAECLVRAGIPLDLRNVDGHTPLQCLQSRGSRIYDLFSPFVLSRQVYQSVVSEPKQRLLKLIIDSGAHLDARNDQGEYNVYEILRAWDIWDDKFESQSLQCLAAVKIKDSCLDYSTLPAKLVKFVNIH